LINPSIGYRFWGVPEKALDEFRSCLREGYLEELLQEFWLRG
jgi:hypothetical protein